MPLVMSANLLPQISGIVLMLIIPVLIVIGFFATVFFQFQIWKNTKAMRADLDALLENSDEPDTP
ncbi:MAG: hypothetical protein Q4E03_03305 [Trueperella sp.]|nr:hypothetical protein [Trueperella sp.]